MAPKKSVRSKLMAIKTMQARAGKGVSKEIPLMDQGANDIVIYEPPKRKELETAQEKAPGEERCKRPAVEESPSSPRSPARGNRIDANPPSLGSSSSTLAEFPFLEPFEGEREPESLYDKRFEIWEVREALCLEADKVKYDHTGGLKILDFITKYHARLLSASEYIRDELQDAYKVRDENNKMLKEYGERLLDVNNRLLQERMEKSFAESDKENALTKLSEVQADLKVSEAEVSRLNKLIEEAQNARAESAERARKAEEELVSRVNDLENEKDALETQVTETWKGGFDAALAQLRVLRPSLELPSEMGPFKIIENDAVVSPSVVEISAGEDV